MQTLTFDSVGRAGYYHFPDAGQFEKVIMQYSMRCKHALITTQHAPNDVGCGEWDYNCETYITDSSRTDSVKSTTTPGTYDKWPQKYELMSFVTPYGIGLDLGKTGKMWEFDVTDYVTVLKGWKRLSMERGSGQEEFDLKFLFIKGTPARQVLDMQQIWPMTEEGYATIQADTRYEPRTVHLNPNAQGFKLRSYITGHGQQGEFIAQTHYISVDNTKYERLVWKECAADPVVAQGGTWVYSRAGWCPGMATDLAEYEITGTVSPGANAKLDYGVEGGSGDSRYDPSTQLVSYGAPNFKNDAGIVDIQRPSDHIQYGKINPACDLPIVVLRNNGSNELTSVRFEYYVDGGPHRVYNWSGHMAFLDTLALALPVDSVSFWTAAKSGKFHVDLSLPNGVQDEYDPNNHYSSNYTQPPQYTGAVVVSFLSNHAPGENYYEIRNMLGATVFSNNSFDDSTQYYDSLALPAGCYSMIFHDDGLDGISFWANPGQGNGVLRLRQGSRSGKVLKNFSGDFGKFIQYDFTIAQSPAGVGTAEVPFRRVSLYPNPAESVVHVQLDGYPSEVVMLEIVDERGNVLRREQHPTGTPGTLNDTLKLDGFAKGNYFVRVTTKDGSSENGFVIQ